MIQKIINAEKDSSPDYAFIDHGLTSVPGLPRFFTCPIKYDSEGWSEVCNLDKLVSHLDDNEKKELFDNVNESIHTAERFLGK